MRRPVDPADRRSSPARPARTASISCGACSPTAGRCTPPCATSTPPRRSSAATSGCAPCGATSATRARCARSSATSGRRSSTTSPARAASAPRSPTRRRPGSRTRTSSSTCSTRSGSTARRRASTRPPRARCSARCPARASSTTSRRRSTRRARTRRRRPRRTCSAGATASPTGSGSPAGSSSTTSRAAAAPQFLSRKVVDHVHALRTGAADGPLALGNLKAQRDWGFAPDYVDGMVTILRQAEARGVPDEAASYRDYVLGTGRLHSVWELADRAFALAGLRARVGSSTATTRSAGRPASPAPASPRSSSTRRSSGPSDPKAIAADPAPDRGRARLGAEAGPRPLPRGHARPPPAVDATQ